MTPRSVHRILALATAGLLAAAVMHDVVPHQPIHEALAQGHSNPTATPTHPPIGTATAMPTATQTGTPVSTATLTPTGAPTATSTPQSGGSGTCAVHDPNTYHGAVGPGGCTYGHEHGDAVPGWVTQAGYQVAYTGPFNTSAIENGLAPDDATPTRLGKHNAMKGYGWTTENGVGVYIRYHGASNVHDRMSRFHSYEIFIRETNGTVSHSVGWLNSGVPTRFGNGAAGAGGRRNICSNEVDIRPEVEVVTSMAQYMTCNTTELWYWYAMGWGPTVTITMDATTIAYAGEASQTSMVNWQRTGSVGTSRGAGLTWYAQGDQNNPQSMRPLLNQPFWATQFQETVTGPTDPRCSGTTTFKANPTATIHPFDVDETYQNVCLQQYISSSMPFVNSAAPGRDYGSGFGLRLPN